MVFLIALVIGCFKVLSAFLRFISFFSRHCCRGRCQRKDRLYQMYGKTVANSPDERSWAVVSGGSDGIGFALARHLAVEIGFNICIVSRNEEKMKSKLQLISDECTKNGRTISTKFVVADFEKMPDIQAYEKVLCEPLRGLDIGMLVLNAGWGQFGPFYWQSMEETERQVKLNVMHAVYMAKVLLSQQIERFERTGKKSGMIFTSSILGRTPTPGYTVYSAGKAFDDFMARGLNVELDGKVDVMSYNAGMVDTPFHHGNDVVTGNPIIIKANVAAETCLRDMGHGPSTFGAFIHDASGFPDWAGKFMFKASKQSFK